LLGHRNTQKTLIYITIDNVLSQNQIDEFHVKTAKTSEEACKLIEVGFEYVKTICDVHIYRKRKHAVKITILGWKETFIIAETPSIHFGE
jgi:hypothetical protein